MSNRMYRLPIHHDDRVFRDQTERMFRDMQLRMDGGLHQTWPELDGTWTRTSSTSDSLSQPTRADTSFFQLKPRQIPIQQVPGASASEKRGSREILDDATIGDLFLEDPQTKSRMFRMSFDVSKYDPKDVQVRVEDKCLMVEAKMVETSRGGAQTTSEFNRRIMLPNDVDVEKLTSTLSSDGVLTLQAPCPPRYQALGGVTGSIQSGDGAMLGLPQRVSPVQFTSLPSQFAGNTQFQSTPPKQSPISIQHTSSPLVAQGASPTQQGGPRAPVVISVMPATPGSVPIDTPIFTTIDGGRRRLDLVLDLGRQYAAQDVVVKVDGRKMYVEATREEKEHGRTCKTSVTREFDLSEDIDPGTVQAMMKPDGELAIVATTPYRR